MALQHAGEAILHLGRRLADGDCAGDVRGAVEILRAGIDQIEFALLQGAVGRLGGPVMHDGSVGPGAGNGVKTEVAEELARATKIGKPGDGSQLVDFSLGRLMRQPVEESRHRQSIAAMGGTGPGELSIILACLGQKAWVVALRQIGSGRAKPIEGPGRRGLRIDEDPGLGFA